MGEQQSIIEAAEAVLREAGATERDGWPGRWDLGDAEIYVEADHWQAVVTDPKSETYPMDSYRARGYTAETLRMFLAGLKAATELASLKAQMTGMVSLGQVEQAFMTGLRSSVMPNGEVQLEDSNRASVVRHIIDCLRRNLQAPAKPPVRDRADEAGGAKE